MERRRNKKKPKGFYYSVSDEQIRQHRHRSIEEIFDWLEETNKFIYQLQTPREREISKKIRAAKF